MKRAAWMVAGLLAGALAYWPAASLQSALQRALPPGSEVALSGSLWAGQGQLRLAGGGTWPMAWRVQPLRLFSGQLAWQVHAEPVGGRASAEAALGLGGWAVRASSFDGEIRSLHAWVPALRLMGVQGRAQWRAPDLAWTPAAPWRIEGEGRLVLSDLSVAAIGGSTLGTHELQAKGSGGAVTVDVVRSDGLLKLEGGARIDNTGDYALQGSALPLSSFDADARTRLARYAAAQADGRFRFDVRGKW